MKSIANNRLVSWMLAGLFFLTEHVAYAQDFNALRSKMVKGKCFTFRFNLPN